MELCMVKVNLFGMTILNMKAIISMVKNKAKANLLSLKEIIMMGFG